MPLAERVLHKHTSQSQIYTVNMPNGIQFNSSVTTEDRHDIREFIICFAPLLHCKRSLPDTSWTLLLSLTGVSDVSGEIISNDKCCMRGVMSTHPPIIVDIELTIKQTASVPLYALTGIKLK